MRSLLQVSIRTLTLATLFVGACGTPAEEADLVPTGSPVQGVSISEKSRTLRMSSGVELNWTSGLPFDAIVGGTDADGTPLYICRANYMGAVHPGKTRKDWGSGCDIGWGGGEHWVIDSQVLVPGWASADHGAIPPDAVAYGNEASNTPLFICRASYAGGLQTGKIGPNTDGCYIPFGGREIHVPNYEVLVNPNQLPFRALSVAPGTVPAQGVVGGHEADGTPLYPCVAPYAGGLHPGKTRKDWGSCDISWGGGEHSVTTYQVLVPQFNSLPLNAAIHPYAAGSERGTELGVCNADYAGSMQLGKYLTDFSCNFGYGGREISLSSGYHVLSTYATTIPINYDTGYITFPDPIPVGGSATLTIKYDGSYYFSGHFHDSGSVCFNDGIVLAIKTKSGRLFTFAHSGSMGATFCGGSRDDTWNVAGSNPTLAAAWADLQAGGTISWKASTGLDLRSLIDLIIKAADYISKAIAIVG